MHKLVSRAISRLENVIGNYFDNISIVSVNYSKKQM